MFSIVVPIFNAQDTLSSCVESLRRQSFNDIEIVLVNDGSTDNSLEICHQLAQQDSRIKVINQSNQGSNAARWNGVKNAFGEWITFVDADDEQKLNAIESFAKAAIAETNIIIGAGHLLGKHTGSPISPEELQHFAVRGDGLVSFHWGHAYRKSILKEQFFNTGKELPIGEDYIFWLRLAFNNDSTAVAIEDNVYVKKAAHISSTFHWTANYAEKIHQLRMEAIPAELQKDFMHDLIKDRIVSLAMISVDNPKKLWKKSPFYLQILSDMSEIGEQLSFKQKLFFSLPSIQLRRSYSQLTQIAAFIRGKYK